MSVISIVLASLPSSQSETSSYHMYAGRTPRRCTTHPTSPSLAEAVRAGESRHVPLLPERAVRRRLLLITWYGLGQLTHRAAARSTARFAGFACLQTSCDAPGSWQFSGAIRVAAAAAAEGAWWP